MTKTYGLNGVINQNMTIEWSHLLRGQQALLGYLYPRQNSDIGLQVYGDCFYVVPDVYEKHVQFLWDSGIIQIRAGQDGVIRARLNEWAMKYLQENL